MLKKLLLTSVMVLFVASVSFAQNIHYKKIAPEQDVQTSVTFDKTGPIQVDYPYDANDPAVGAGDPIANTDYDYYTNTVMRPQVIHIDGVTYSIFMCRDWTEGSDATVRYGVFDVYDGSAHTQILPFGENYKGWPAVDASLTGSTMTGIPVVVEHSGGLQTNAYLPGTGFQGVTDVSGNVYPSIAVVGDNIYLNSDNTSGAFHFLWKSTDLNISYTLLDSTNAYYPTAVEDGAAEMSLVKSPDETYVLQGNLAARNGNIVDGVAEADADVVYYLLSTDGGTTWALNEIGYAGDPNMVSTTVSQAFADSVTYVDNAGDTVSTYIDGTFDFTYVPLLANFSQVNFAVDNNGVVHAVANGYGVTLYDYIEGTDTIQIQGDSYFPVLYYNSTADAWSIIDYDGMHGKYNLGADYVGYPGNGIGFYYPSVVVDETSNKTLVTFSGPEFDGSGAVNFDTSGLYFTDCYYALSGDMGTTWSTGTIDGLNSADVAETFVNPARFFNSDGTIELVYLNDASPGVSIFGEGVSTNTNMHYQKKWTVPAVGVNDGVNEVVSSYSLDQNYPNPFNPTTNITFTLKESNMVTLKVYDVLGREVATLISEQMNAGSHEVTFDASKLSSGIYVYTINAGDFAASKKMMLMK